MSQDRLGIAGDFRIAISDEVREIERRLGRGTSTSYEDYLARCAEIRALERSLTLFDRILERYLEEDETDELESV